MRRDLAQTTFGVLFIVTLIVASFWIIRPFLVPVIWAAMIVDRDLAADARGSRPPSAGGAGWPSSS